MHCIGGTLLILLFTYFTATAQLVQPARTEIEVSLMDEEHELISGQEWGLLVHQRSRKESTFKLNVYNLTLFDTLLQEQWKTQISVENKFTYAGYEHQQGRFYMMFVHSGGKYSEYRIVTIDAQTSLSRTYSLKIDLPIELTEFSAIGDLVIFGGYVNFRPSVVVFDLTREQLRVLPGLYQKNSELIEVRANPQQQSFTILYTDRSQGRQHTIASKTYDMEANLLLEYSLQPKNDLHLLYGRTTQFSDSAVHIAGTYAKRNSDFSQGIYVSSVFKDGTQKIKYYPYAELQNFFVYMSDKRQERLKQRIKRKKAQDKTIEFNYRLLIHDLIPHNNEYILLAEAFYPKYNASSPVGSGSRAFRSNSTNYLEGYKYTHAIMLGFNGNGTLLWDNGFEINEVFQPSLQKLVHVLPGSEQSVLVFAYEGELQTKIIKDSEVLAAKESNALQLVDFSGEARNEAGVDIQLHDWYGNTLYAYGEQRIKNAENSNGQSTRRVFFINKISYIPQPLADLQKADAEGVEKK